uniref:Putative phospholipid-transporting ATPase DRS2 n=1 Tax=Lygus hesperus TaxID=30085 RepID=A0A0A9YL94_LYGHE
MCVGRKVFLFRNNRIIDNPSLPQRQRKHGLGKSHYAEDTYETHYAQNYHNRDTPPPPALASSSSAMAGNRNNYLQPPSESIPHYTIDLNPDDENSSIRSNRQP